MMAKQVFCSLGAVLLVGGVCSFLYGHAGLNHYGVMDGLGIELRPQSLMVGGGIAAAVGAGLAVLGRMMRVAR